MTAAIDVAKVVEVTQLLISATRIVAQYAYVAMVTCSVVTHLVK